MKKASKKISSQPRGPNSKERHHRNVHTGGRRFWLFSNARWLAVDKLLEVAEVLRTMRRRYTEWPPEVLQSVLKEVTVLQRGLAKALEEVTVRQVKLTEREHYICLLTGMTKFDYVTSLPKLETFGEHKQPEGADDSEPRFEM